MQFSRLRKFFLKKDLTNITLFRFIIKSYDYLYDSYIDINNIYIYFSFHFKIDKFDFSIFRKFPFTYIYIYFSCICSIIFLPLLPSIPFAEMLRIYLILTIAATAAMAQVPFLGSCPVVETIPNFDIKKVSGRCIRTFSFLLLNRKLEKKKFFSSTCVIDLLMRQCNLHLESCPQ